MKIIPAILLAIYSFGACAQTEKTETNPAAQNYKYAIKAYASGLLTPYNNDGYNWRPLAESYDYVHPSVSVMIQTKRGNYHELELSEIDFKHTDISQRFKQPNGGYLYQTRYKLSDTRIALRYEYIINLIKRSNARLVPSVSWAAMPYFNKFAQRPYSSVDYPITTTVLGVKSFITPRLQMNISKRVFADVNVPICLIDMGTQRQNIENPTLPARAQKYGIVDFQMMPRYFTARLGLGLKI